MAKVCLLNIATVNTTESRFATGNDQFGTAVLLVFFLLLLFLSVLFF